jgi:hypothetical protein
LFAPYVISFLEDGAASVAALIVVRPTVEVKAVEGDSLRADRYHRELGPHLAIEAIAVHAEIAWCIP